MKPKTMKPETIKLVEDIMAFIEGIADQPTMDDANDGRTTEDQASLCDEWIIKARALCAR